MVRLSPRQIQTLANFVCGDTSGPFGYRRMVDIDAFFEFTGAEPVGSVEGGSRWTSACGFIESCQRSQAEGESGLSREVEKVIEALLDRREFDSDADRDEGVRMVNEALRGVPVEVRVAGDGSVRAVSTKRTRSQVVLDEQIHTAFGTVIRESDLAAARTHYSKAKRYLSGPERDYENAAKEAVSSLESLVLALTGESDFARAVKKAAAADLLPRPVDEIAIKLYAYRGNEPGVAHGHANAPDVTEDEAELVFNLAAALAAYCGKRLRQTLSRGSGSG